MRQSDFSEYQSSGDEQPGDKRDAPKGYRDAETLRNMYHDELLSTADIARHFDVSSATILKYMDRGNVERPPFSKSVYSQWGRGHPAGYKNPELLREMYWDDRMSMNEIGEHFDRSESTIKHHMNKHGLERRSGSEAKYVQWERKNEQKADLTRGFLQEVYVEKRLSATFIAEQTGYSIETVHRRLSEHGLERRSQSEAVRVQKLRAPPSFGIQSQGYEIVRTTYEGESYHVLVHRLAAIAWFGWDAVVDNDVVHHKSTHPRDNREENLEPMTKAEHQQWHAANGDFDR